MFLEPFVHVEEEILLAPEHPGQRLAHDRASSSLTRAGVMDL